VEPAVKKIERRQETMSVQVTPLHDRVLIKRIEEKETVKGGIIIPDTAKEKPQEGEVIAVGAGKINEKGDRISLDVKAGDRVLFGKYSGTEIKVDDEDYLILREDEILAKLSGAAKAAGGNFSFTLSALSDGPTLRTNRSGRKAAIF
jgi:chaperonin GroES